MKYIAAKINTEYLINFGKNSAVTNGVKRNTLVNITIASIKSS